MALTESKREKSVANVMRRLRENAGLTTRQAAGIIGVTHTTISQYETGFRQFSSLRIEQLVRAYGYTMTEFEKILGHKSVISFKDDCITMIEQLDEGQAEAVRQLLCHLLRKPIAEIATGKNENCNKTEIKKD